MKEKILQKTIDLFINYGFKSVTMDDIASEMHISKKTIYSHFNNKTELVKASSFQMFDAISKGIKCICSLHKNPIEELYEIKKYVMVHLKNEKTSPHYQLCKYYPEINDALKKKHFELIQGCIVDNFNRGLKLGLYRTNINVEFVARIYFAGKTGIKDENLFPTKSFPKKELMDRFLEYHLRGIITSEGLNTLNQIIKKNNNE
ncbi:MAG: TetR/AcrR family transcriptional regulator [Flavobacteriaceae bacterium]|nr:TetR/AcrR family transcriptional regulator [Flavobacteriaceae bacterium]